MQLTKHFTIAELCLSSYAVRHDIPNLPNAAQRNALGLLATNILEPLRVRAGRSLIVSSGLRVAAVNKAVGGSSTSQHKDGEAADFTILRMSPYTTCQMIMAMGLPFDQLIHEFGQWVHVSHNSNRPQRGQVLTAVKRAGRTAYLPGLQ